MTLAADVAAGRRRGPGALREVPVQGRAARGLRPGRGLLRPVQRGAGGAGRDGGHLAAFIVWKDHFLLPFRELFVPCL